MERNWQVFDGQTGRALQPTYRTFSAANRAAERLNQRYGAVRYGVRLEPELTLDQLAAAAYDELRYRNDADEDLGYTAGRN